MKIVGIDASSTCTAMALRDDGELVAQRVINLKKNKDAKDRIIQMMKYISEQLREWNPDTVFIEASPGMTPQVTRLISQIVGAVKMVCIELDCGCNDELPNVWRSYLGIGGGKRDELKQKAVDYVNEHYGLHLEFADNDLAEAICISEAGEIIMAEAEFED